MKRLNKVTAATLAGALVTIAASFIAMTPEVQGSVQTLMVAALVWAIPNS